MKSRLFVGLFAVLFLLVFSSGALAIINDPSAYLTFSQNSGNALNVTGGTSYLVGSGITQTATGIVGNAYSFVSGNGGVNLTNATYTYVDAPANFSYVVFLKFDVFNPGDAVFDKSGTTIQQGVALYPINTGPQMRIGVPFDDLATGDNPGNTTWNCLAVTYDGSTKNLTYYNNASFQTSKTLGFGIGTVEQPANTINLFLGAQHDDGFQTGLTSFQGKMDQFALYTRKLSTADVGAICGNWSAGVDFMVPNNQTPVVQTTSVVASFNNRTLSLRANATDADGDTNYQKFFYSVFQNGTLFASGSTAQNFQQGLDVNFVNVTTNTTQGVYSYIVQVIANDGIHNSSAVNSSATLVTVPLNQVPVVQSSVINVTASRSKLLLYANATDGNNDTVSYNWRVFLNGTLVNSGTGSTFFTQGRLVNFANTSLNGTPGTYKLEVMANDAIALSAAVNSSNLFVGRFVFPRPAGYYKFDEASPGPVVDSADYPVNGSIVGSVSVGSIAGLGGFGYEFSSDAGYLDFTNTQKYAIGRNFTSSVWIKNPSPGDTTDGYNNVYGKDSNGFSEPSLYDVEFGDGSLYIELQDPDGRFIDWAYNHPLITADDQWHLFTTVIQEGVIHVYIDGAEVTPDSRTIDSNFGTSPLTTTDTVFATDTLNGLGTSADHGSYDDFMMWNNTALNASTAEALYFARADITFTPDTNAGVTAITACMNITVSGDYELTSNVTGTNFWEDANIFGGVSTQCLRVTASNVNIDGNGYTLLSNASEVVEIVGGPSNVNLHDIVVSGTGGGNGPIAADGTGVTISDVVVNGAGTSGVINTAGGASLTLTNVAGAANNGLEISGSTTLVANNVTIITAGGALENQGEADNVTIEHSYLNGSIVMDGNGGAVMALRNTTLNYSAGGFFDDALTGEYVHNTWASPIGDGYSDTCFDANSDAICDTPYTPGTSLTDNTPVALHVGNTPLTPALTANWTFDQAQRNTTHRFDTSGNGRNLTVVNLTDTIANTFFKVNGIHKDGDKVVAGGLYTAAPMNLGTNFSICGYVQMDNNGAIVSTQNGTTDGYMKVFKSNGVGDTSVYIQSDFAGTEWTEWTFAGVVPNSTPEYVCVVYNGTNVANGVTFYVNGSLQTETGYSDNGLQALTSTDWSGNFHIGDNDSVNFYADEFLVYQGTTLSDQNVSDLFESFKATPVVQTVTLTATSANQTLVASVNVTDDNYGDQETMKWRLFRNNTLISSGTNGTFPQGVTVNFNNFSTNSVDGTYIVEVTGQDAVPLNSSAVNSTGVNVTFPSAAKYNLSLRLNTTSNINLTGFNVYVNGTLNGTAAGLVYSVLEISGDYNITLEKSGYNNVSSVITISGADVNRTLFTDDWLGHGTLADPFQIYTYAQLDLIRNNLSSSFQLMNDIDASGQQWTPVGQLATEFTGQLNGNKKKIMHLNITSGARRGLFGALKVPANITDLGLTDVFATTGSATGSGSLVGIINIGVSGNVLITRSYATGNMSVSGGATTSAGGFLGTQSGATGSIVVTDSYSQVTTLLSTGSTVGGFVGGVSSNFACTNCYSSGLVVSSGGGAFSGNAVSTTATFWDNQTSGQTTGVSGTGKSTRDMKTKSTFTGAGWNFTTVWYMGTSGYPELRGFATPFEVSVQLNNSANNTLLDDFCVQVNGTVQGCSGTSNTNLSMSLNSGSYNFTSLKTNFTNTTVIRSITGNDSFQIVVSPSNAAQLAPVINFTAVNISNNVTITTFCVNGTGTNTSFSTCTNTGVVQNNFTGTYNYTAYNASGFQDQTVLNFNFSANASIQFNLTQINFVPVVQTVTLAATADNQTLIANANATDANGGTLTFNWKEFRDSILIGSGSDGPFQQGVTANFRNFSTMSVNGSYIVEVTATDGINLSNSVNSSAVNVTFPIPIYNLTVKWNDTYNNAYVQSFCVELNSSGVGCTANGQFSIDVANATYLVGIKNNAGAYYNVTSVKVVAGETNVTLSTRPLLAVNTTTDKAFYWNATDTNVLTQKSDNGGPATSYDYFIDGSAASNVTALTSLSVGTHTATVRLRETVESVERQANSTASFNVTKLTGATNVQPSGVNFTQAPINVNFSAAANNFSAITYDVIVNFNGTNQTIATGLTTPTNTLINGTETSNGIVYVLAHDGLVTATTQNAQLFTVTFVPAISATQFCPVVTAPNEDDSPTVAVIPVSFNVTSYASFSGETVQVQLSTTGQTANATLSDCAETTVSAIQHNYVCNVTMHYYYAPANYTRYVNVTINGQSNAATVSTICGYSGLLASQRTVDVVSFPTAGPGIVDAAGTPVMVVRNTGNEPFNLSVLAYHLQGRTSPTFLLASDFKVGVNATSAVQMANAVTTPINVTVSPSAGAEGDVTIFLSMPSNQEIQEYYAPTPWEMVVSG